MLADQEETTPELSEYEKDRLAWNLPRPANEPRPARAGVDSGGRAGESRSDESSHSEAA